MPRSYLYFALAATSLLIGCQKNKEETVSLKESIRQAPTLAIAPVIDNSKQSLGWDVSQEFTHALCLRLEKTDRVSLSELRSAKTLAKKLKANHHPFTGDLQWAKTAFPKEDFVVFLELLEHDEVPNQSTPEASPEECSAQLNLSMRIRVLDLRSQMPKVILQEIVRDSHFVPRQFTHYHFHQEPWGSEDFSISPVGIAHAQLIKEVASRVEDYILITKNSQ